MKKGDTVEAIDDHLKGVVLNISGDQVLILTAEGFEISYPAADLVVIGDELKKKAGRVPKDVIHSKQKDRKKKNALRNVQNNKRQKSAPPRTIDLHIEKLVASTKSMSNHDMRTLQLDTAKREVELALAKRIPRLVFIHGVGDGVLKADLDALLRRYDDRLDFFDADYRQYGRGATEVRIFQRPR